MAKRRLLSDRLLAVVRLEVRTLERGRDEAGEEELVPAKTRLEAIGNLTKTLEKLLELRRIEALEANGGAAEDDAEAEALKTEMMRRLRALDARREGERRLFDPSPAATEAAA